MVPLAFAGGAAGQSADDYFTRGEDALTIGDLKTAVRDYSKAIDLETNFAKAYCARGCARFFLGDLNGAVADSTRTIELDPDGPLAAKAYDNRGSAKYSRGDSAGALADYTSAISLTRNEIHPENAEVYSHRGMVKLDLRDWDGALVDSSNAIAVRSENSLAKRVISQAISAKSPLEFDFGYYAARSRPAPEDPHTYINRGLACRARGDWSGAIAEFTRAIELDAVDDEAYRLRGTVRRATGDWRGAIADFSKAIEANSDSAEPYGARAVARQFNSDATGAMEDCSNTIRLDPKDGANYVLRGQLDYYAQSFTNAVRDFAKAVELNPSDDHARFGLWLVRARLGEAEAAGVDLRKHLAARQSTKTNDWTSEVGRFLAGDLTEPAFLTAARTNDPVIEARQYCEAYYYAAAKRLIDGDRDTAIDYFWKCVAGGERNSAEYVAAAVELRRLVAFSPRVAGR